MIEFDYQRDVRVSQSRGFRVNEQEHSVESCAFECNGVGLLNAVSFMEAVIFLT